jgi:YVTN family beta-propeller protein
MNSKINNLEKVLLVAVVTLFSLSSLSSAFVFSSAYTKTMNSANSIKLAVSDYGSNAATIVSPSDNNSVKTVSIGFEPAGQIGWDGKYFWVTNIGSESVSLIQASDNRYARGITGFKEPAGVLYDPSNNVAYVADFGANVVYPVNDTTLATGPAIPVGEAPEFMAYSPVTNEVYVANQEGGTVSVINSTNSVVATITIGTPGENGLSGIAYVPTTKSIDVIDFDNFGIYQINSNNRIAKFGIFSGYPWNLVFNPKNGMLYATASSTGQILVINPKTLDLSSTITCPKKVCATQAAPLGVAYDSQNGLVYVVDDNNDILIPINGTSIVTPAIPTGEYPQGVMVGSPIA